MWRYFISDLRGSGNAPSAEVTNGNLSTTFNFPHRAIHISRPGGRGGRMKPNIVICPECNRKTIKEFLKGDICPRCYLKKQKAIQKQNQALNKWMNKKFFC